jgi:hypothetical protein
LRVFILAGAAKFSRTNQSNLTQKLTKNGIYDIINLDSSDAKIFLANTLEVA